jgi:hypothetical protein
MVTHFAKRLLGRKGPPRCGHTCLKADDPALGSLVIEVHTKTDALK